MAELQIPTTQTVAWIVDPGPNGRLDIRKDVEVGQPGEGEVLVKMECSGIWYSPPSPSTTPYKVKYYI
jgi:alcohol dehydrogenase, propanol-preferring